MQNKKIKKLLIVTLFFIFIIFINNKVNAYTFSALDFEDNFIFDYFDYDNRTTAFYWNNTYRSYTLPTDISNYDYHVIFLGEYRICYVFFNEPDFLRVNMEENSSKPGYYRLLIYNGVNAMTSFFTYSVKVDTGAVVSSRSSTYSYQNNYMLNSSGFVDATTLKELVDLFIIDSTVPLLEYNSLEEIYSSSPVNTIIFETPTLYIDDMNLRKRFKFQFNIPMVRADTKYYVFLEDYNRISYDSVNVTFRIYTVTTPEGYDYTDYENYMYYDNRLKDTNLILPAGCEIHEFVTICGNNNMAELNEIQSYTAERIRSFNNIYNALIEAEHQSFEVFEENNYNSFYTYLFPSNHTISSNSSYYIYNIIAKAFNTITINSYYHIFESVFSKYYYNVKITHPSDIVYYQTLLDWYYSDFNSYNFKYFRFEDFCFSNSSIVSYEPIRTVDKLSGNFYNIFRKTKVYNQNNRIENVGFLFSYSDTEDVSSMLPQGTSVEYLTSPFYKHNENSSSGGYITYDIQEIFQGDKIIDYSKEDNSIHNDFNGNYIENFQEGDNIVINNYYTETIDKTSDEHLLHNIYLAILEIKSTLSSMSDSISNTTNNFTYNTSNTIKYYVIPNSYVLDNIKKQITDAADEHLGILTEPFKRNTIYFYCNLWTCNRR